MSRLMISALWAIVVISTIAFGAITPKSAQALEDIWLITPEEAATAPEPEISRSGHLPFAGEGSLGPTIEVFKPTNGGSAPSPVEIDIKFLPKLNPVNLQSLKVSVVKFINIDITERVRSHASTTGIHLPAAQIPTGKHTVRISIADTEGLRSMKDVTFEVLDKES